MAEKNEYLGKAYDRLTKISADEEKRMEYLAREMAIRDFNYLMGENLRQGRAKGRAEGQAEGELLKLIRLVRKKKNKGISVTDCAEMLEDSPDTILRLYQMMELHPDWEDIQICEELMGTLRCSSSDHPPIK